MKHALQRPRAAAPAGPVADPRRRGWTWSGMVALLASMLLGALAAGAAASPPAGEAAPPIKLRDLDGKEVDTGTLAPRSQVIIFGDPGHDGVRKAIKDVLDEVNNPRHASEKIATILVISHNDSPAQMKEESRTGSLPPVVLHDPERQAFGAYRILVMPTVVVVDPHGKVVHSMSGPAQHFKEYLGAALLLCAGKMSQDEFRRIISPEAPAATSPAEVRADRLVHLGEELVRHGLYETAESQFKEAAEIAPDNLRARLGLAGVMLRTGRLDEAEAAYRAVATADEGSVDATIGVATAQALRGGEGLRQAELTASELVAKHPSMAKVRYLMGLIHERKGNCAAALAEFKRAAELAMVD